MQNFRVVRIAHRDLENKCNHVQEDKDENSWRASELTMATPTFSLMRDWDRTESS